MAHSESKPDFAAFPPARRPLATTENISNVTPSSQQDDRWVASTMAELSFREVCKFTGLSWLITVIMNVFFKLNNKDLWDLVTFNTTGSELSAEDEDWSPGINDIPEECLVYLLRFLEHRDLIRCAFVCKHWKTTVDAHPELWRSAELRLLKPPKKSFFSLLYPPDRNRTYVDCLIAKEARLKYLSVDLYHYDGENFQTLSKLLSSGCCHRLRNVKLTWYESKRCTERARSFGFSFAFFISTLTLLRAYCDGISTLNCQMNWTDESVKHISSFVNLRMLEIGCMPRVHNISKQHIDTLLQSLRYLQIFRLTVTIEQGCLQRYAFRSQSLRTLDISGCVNVMIGEMDLPNLESFNANGILCHRKCVSEHKFCLFDVLRDGCPSLQVVNDTRVYHDSNDLGLSEEEKSILKICFCPRHKKMTPRTQALFR